VGQGAASGAVRPAPAIRRYKRGFLRRFTGSTVQHLALELLQQSLPTLSGRLFGDLEAGCDVFPARATKAHDEKAVVGLLQRLHGADECILNDTYSPVTATLRIHRTECARRKSAMGGSA
jgi:hypothetical protein